jgi:hypothetical protein
VQKVREQPEKNKEKKASVLSDSSGTDADDESDGGKSLKNPDC